MCRSGALALNNEINKCGGITPFLLAGYSEGAWVIEMAMDQRLDYGTIRGIGLLGDPQWDDPSGATGHSRGLARIARGIPGAYPLLPGRTRTWCLGHDPICGVGYENRPVQQVSDAVNCESNHCPHLNYISSGLAKDIGDFLADRAAFV
jgi:hypothetical protein